MERKTFSVGFVILRAKINKKGEAPIEMRITVDGVRLGHSIKRTVLETHWNSAKGCAYLKNRECRELNAYMDTIKARLMQLQREMVEDGEVVTARTLLNKFCGVSEKPQHTILELYREHNEKCEKLSGRGISPSTVQRYRTSYDHTAKFIKRQYGVADIDITKIDRKFITDYEFYFRSECGCCHNTTVKYLKNFKKITNIALSNELIAKDPFLGIKFHYEEVEREFLSEQELNVVATKEFAIERLTQVRDVFLFCCLTGLSFADVKQLRKEHIIQDSNGALWIRKARQKTKVMCNIPLLDAAQKILDRYQDSPECKDGMLLPVLSNQKYNSYIKEIMDLCGINKEVSTHVARHTAATTVFLANGASMESVAKMLGHTDTRMTRHYAKVLDRSIMSDMAKVNTRVRIGL